MEEYSDNLEHYKFYQIMPRDLRIEALMLCDNIDKDFFKWDLEELDLRKGGKYSIKRPSSIKRVEKDLTLNAASPTFFKECEAKILLRTYADTIIVDQFGNLSANLYGNRSLIMDASGDLNLRITRDTSVLLVGVEGKINNHDFSMYNQRLILNEIYGRNELVSVENDIIKISFTPLSFPNKWVVVNQCYGNVNVKFVDSYRNKHSKKPKSF